MDEDRTPALQLVGGPLDGGLYGLQLALEATLEDDDFLDVDGFLYFFVDTGNGGFLMFEQESEVPA